MQHSITLDTKVRLLTGLKFANISCNPRHLSKCLTTAVFNFLQKHPSVSETFMILVISGMIYQSTFFNIVVGIASSSQYLLLREARTTLTCFSVIGAKHTRCGMSISGALHLGLFLSVSLIFSILPWKYEAKSSANWPLLVCSGYSSSTFLLLKLLTRACNHLESLAQSSILPCKTPFFLRLSLPKYEFLTFYSRSRVNPAYT